MVVRGHAIRSDGHGHLQDQGQGDGHGGDENGQGRQQGALEVRIEAITHQALYQDDANGIQDGNRDDDVDHHHDFLLEDRDAGGGTVRHDIRLALTNLCVGTCETDHTISFPGLHGGAGQDELAVLLTGILARQRLSGQRSGVDAQDISLQPLHICRGQGPTTQVDHVSGDQLGDGEGLGLPIPQTGDTGLHLIGQLRQGILGFHLFAEAQGGVHQDHGQNHEEVGPVPRGGGDDAAHLQHHRHGPHELRQDHLPNRRLYHWNLIGAILLHTFLGLRRGETITLTSHFSQGIVLHKLSLQFCHGFATRTHCPGNALTVMSALL
mmetsp:Transcript_68432/g.107576  ORF Transcript_68432/g.107576 Transcript_68432/m.107576 type:complete len:323 (-) Transcript_68432:44-1012(-)